MNEIGYILTTIGGVISAITLFYKAFSSDKQKSFTNVIAEKDKDLKQKSQDAEIYRRRWLKAEAENDKLRKELNKDDN
ncbi:MAG: hypothetical protein LKH52_04645 [Lactobacillus crispatus]|nr:hypothetical protein [Lactobacillus crispatus]